MSAAQILWPHCSLAAVVIGLTFLLSQMLSFVLVYGFSGFLHINLHFSCPKMLPRQRLSCSKSAFFNVFQQLLFSGVKVLGYMDPFGHKTCMSALEATASFVSGCVDSAVFLTFSFSVSVEGDRGCAIVCVFVCVHE